MKVLKSWGASGQVVLSHPDIDPEDLKTQGPVFIEFDGLPVPFFIESLQEKGNRCIVKFEDIDTLPEAEELVGREATLGTEAEEDEDTLVGLRVRDAKSRRIIGEIVDMSDYGGFEKVGSLPWEVPTNDEQINTVPGDIILYQGNKITIYYGENSWSLTKLGHIDGVTGEELLEAMGQGDVTVRFWIEWSE